MINTNKILINHSIIIIIITTTLIIIHLQPHNNQMNQSRRDHNTNQHKLKPLMLQTIPFNLIQFKSQIRSLVSLYAPVLTSSGADKLKIKRSSPMLLAIFLLPSIATTIRRSSSSVTLSPLHVWMSLEMVSGQSLRKVAAMQLFVFGPKILNVFLHSPRPMSI